MSSDRAGTIRSRNDSEHASNGMSSRKCPVACKMPALRTVAIVPFALCPFSLDGLVVGSGREGVHSLGKVIDQVANDAGDLEDAADPPLGIDDREPAKAAGGHQADRLADGVVCAKGDRFPNHHGSNRLVEIRAVGQELERIPLGEDSQQPAVAADHGSAGGLLLEQAHHVPDAVLRCNAQGPGRVSVLNRLGLEMELKIHGDLVPRRWWRAAGTSLLAAVRWWLKAGSEILPPLRAT